MAILNLPDVYSCLLLSKDSLKGRAYILPSSSPFVHRPTTTAYASPAVHPGSSPGLRLGSPPKPPSGMRPSFSVDRFSMSSAGGESERDSVAARAAAAATSAAVDASGGSDARMQVCAALYLDTTMSISKSFHYTANFPDAEVV